MVRPLLVKERVVSGFNASKTVILTSKIGIAVEERRFSKIQNWKHYLSKTRVKRKSRRIGMTQQAISKRLKAMGMIQKEIGPYELKPRDVERRLFACE